MVLLPEVVRAPLTQHRKEAAAAGWSELERLRRCDPYNWVGRRIKRPGKSVAGSSCHPNTGGTGSRRR